jgi:hypothetical protein
LRLVVSPPGSAFLSVPLGLSPAFSFFFPSPGFAGTGRLTSFLSEGFFVFASASAAGLASCGAAESLLSGFFSSVFLFCSAAFFAASADLAWRAASAWRIASNN